MVGMVRVTQSCKTLCDPMGCSLPGSSVHGILQARILEWVAISFSKGWYRRDHKHYNERELTREAGSERALKGDGGQEGVRESELQRESNRRHETHHEMRRDGWPLTRSSQWAKSYIRRNGVVHGRNRQGRRDMTTGQRWWAWEDTPHVIKIGD